VIVHEVNVGRIFAGEFENQPEVSRYGDRPLATSAATQGMEPQARERHVTGRFAGIQKGKDTPQPRYMLGRHPAGVPREKQALQTFMAETPNHACNL
jgi:hypothetical protein